MMRASHCHLFLLEKEKVGTQKEKLEILLKKQILEKARDPGSIPGSRIIQV